MSRQSYTHHTFFSVALHTVYSDDGGPVQRSRGLAWTIGAWDAWLNLDMFWYDLIRPARWKYLKESLDSHWYPFDSEDTENMHAQWLDMRRRKV